MSLPAAGTQEKPAIKPCQNFEGHTKWVNGVIHLPGGQQIMTSSWDGSLRVWNSRSGKQIAHDWQDEEDPMNTIALSPDGKKVVGGSMNGVVRLWNINIDTGKAAEWTGHTKYVTSVCWNRDSERVVSGSEDGTARVWDVENGRTVLAIETRFREVAAVSYSPDTTMIATGGENEQKEFLKIWDANTSKIVSNIIKGHTEKVKCLAWTADGRTLISGASDKSIRMWNTATWQQIKVLTEHAGNVEAIAISPNGHILASASWDDTARLWNLENGQPIGSPLQHAASVDSVSFSTDGKLLATGCWDSNAYSWDISMIVREAGLDELLQDPNVSLLFLISLYQLNSLS
jgi:WD40 repeat protein